MSAKPPEIDMPRRFVRRAVLMVALAAAASAAWGVSEPTSDGPAKPPDSGAAAPLTGLPPSAVRSERTSARLEREPAEVIPFPVDHDAPLGATERVDLRADRYTRLRVEFNGIRGDRVPAYLYVPKNQRPRRHPAVLLQYGSGGNKRTNYIVALGEQFVARGFVVLTIDVPMRGERKPKDARGLAALFTDTGRFPWYLGDYSRSIDYLMTRPEVDRERVGYAGISWGAITGLTFAAHEPRVRAVASIVGGGNFLGAIRGALPDETRQQARRIDPLHHVALIAPRPLLLLNVTQDQLVPRFMSDALHAAAGDRPGVVKRWVETDHFFSNVDRFAVLDEVVTFMEEELSKERDH
jgi:dienelactone hydrolase